MAILRFPNPVSDVNKFVQTFRILYSELNGRSDIKHDDITNVMINKALVSSSGAIGKLALERSTRKDRTRDPLYNQIKMYTELYRMLGWIRPGLKKQISEFTEMAQYIEKYDSDENSRNLIEYSIVATVFPNPSVENKKGHIIRPFYQLLKVANTVQQQITRDEIIISILSNQNDFTQTYLDSSALINSVRHDYNALQTAFRRVVGKLTVNTIQNYTRFPLGVLKSLNWCEVHNSKVLYGRSVPVYFLTEKGINLINKLDNMVD